MWDSLSSTNSTPHHKELSHIIHVAVGGGEKYRQKKILSHTKKNVAAFNRLCLSRQFSLKLFSIVNHSMLCLADLVLIIGTSFSLLLFNYDQWQLLTYLTTLSRKLHLSRQGERTINSFARHRQARVAAARVKKTIVGFSFSRLVG